MLFWARISLLTRLVVYVFTLVVALLWFYFICFDFFFLSLEVVLWLGNILLFLDWTSLLEFLATAFVCYVLGVVSLIFLVSIVLCLLIFKKKKNIMGCFSQYLRLLGHCLVGFVVSFAHGMLLS